MLPSLPQMYRKNIIQAIKCAHPLFSLLCRGEPTDTLMRDYRTEQSPPSSTSPRAYGSDACYPICVPSRVRLPKLVALSAYPRAYGTRSLSLYLRTLARTVPMLAALSAYPRAYGSDASTPCSVPLYWFLRILLPLPTYVLDHLSTPTL